MPEQELNLAAAKFISSLTKSLQILCNGQVDFTESIELVGHINVKVDHRFKFDYIVDEQVSKEEDSSTTFLSNSYHSRPPLKQTSKKLSPSELDQQDMFSDIPETFQRKTKQAKSTSEILDHHNVHAEDTSSVRDESSHNYSVSVECQGNQPSQMVVKLEEGEDSNDCMVLPASPGNYNVPGDGSGTEAFPIAGPSGSFEDSEGGLSNLPRKRRKFSEQGNTATKDREPVSTGFNTDNSHKRPRHLVKKTSAAFSCREFLERYNSYFSKKSKICHRQEMTKVFSDLAQKYGVAITIKPAKHSTLINSQVQSENTNPPHSSLATLENNPHFSSTIPAISCASNRSPALALSMPTSMEQLMSSQNLSMDSQIYTVIAADPLSVIKRRPETGQQFCPSVKQDSFSDAKTGTTDNTIPFSETLISLSSSEQVLTDEMNSSQQIHGQEFSSASVPQGVSLPSNQFEHKSSKVTTRSSVNRTEVSELLEPDTPSSALLNAIAVALAKEETSAASATETVTPPQETLRQQPKPRQRGNYLVRLRKEDPDRYEQYKQLSKEEQARERRRLCEANRDPEVIEKKSLMSRVLYLRRVGKLPQAIVDKSNDEIRKIPNEDLKKILPPSKTLKHMDPVVKEEWYRLGRSREWRHKKKLLDPEGFKRYNNERAKKYQDNLRKNNPEKFKELRAKAADRLRQYRFSQRIMKAIKEGKEIKITDPGSPSGLTASKPKRLRVRKKTEEVVEVREAEEDLLVEESIDRSHYIIPECATTHGEAATSRESSSVRTGHSVQQDILDLMYNY